MNKHVLSVFNIIFVLKVLELTWKHIKTTLANILSIYLSIYLFIYFWIRL